MKSLPFLTAAALVSLGSGCSEKGEGAGAFGQQAQSVLGGELSSNESVVLVMGKSDVTSSLCTGTLIAPRLVLTARHCVSRYIEGDYTCTIDGIIDSTRTRTPANAGEMGAVLQGPEVAIHVGAEPDFSHPTTVGKQVLSPETDQICRNDIALVVLEDALDLPLAKLRLTRGVDYREPVMVVGYGINEAKLTQRRQRSGLSILGVGPSEFFEREGEAMPRTFVLESGVCPGDSGGPAYSEVDNEILGVFSLFRGDCTSREARNFFTQVAPFEQLLRDGFHAAEFPFPKDMSDEGSDSGGGGEGSVKDSDENPPQAGSGNAEVVDGSSGSEEVESRAGCSFGAPPRRLGRMTLGIMLLFCYLFKTFVRRKDGQRLEGARDVQG